MVVVHRRGVRQPEQHRGVADPVQPPGRIFGPHEVGSPAVGGVAPARDPDRPVDAAHCGARGHGLPVVDLKGHLAADLQHPFRAGQGQRGLGDLHHTRPRGGQRQAVRRPQLHTGGDIGRRVPGQDRRAGQPGLTEGRDDGSCTGGQRLGREAFLDGGFQPRPTIHGVGVYRKIKPCNVVWSEPLDQRCPGHRFGVVSDTQRVSDLRGHDVEGIVRCPFEEQTLILEVADRIGIVGIDRTLVNTADHQHGRAQHHQRPQRFDLGRTQRANGVEGGDGG